MAVHDTRDPQEIERDIRRTQDDMSDTVDRIGEQLTPRALLNALLDRAEENNVAARDLVDGARRNPIALALIATGAIWLLSDNDARLSTLKPNGLRGNGHDPDWERDDALHRGYIDHMSRIEARDGEDPLGYQRRRDQARASYLMIERDHDEDEKSFRQRLDEATHRLRERRDSMTNKFRESRDRMTERTRHGGSQAADTTRNLANQGRNAYYDQPLIGGLAAALAGALAAGALPVSRREEEHLGELGARAVDEFGREAESLKQKAREKTQEAVEVADRELSRDDAVTQRQMPEGRI